MPVRKKTHKRRKWTREFRSHLLKFMALRALSQMQHNTSVNMQQQPNLSAPYYFENGSQFNDLDSVYSFDDTIEGAAADNYSNLYCPSYSFENITYLNVSCDTALNFSVPLYGEFNDYRCVTMAIIDLCFKARLHRSSSSLPSLQTQQSLWCYRRKICKRRPTQCF